MRLEQRLVSGTACVVLLGSVGLSTVAVSNATASPRSAQSGLATGPVAMRGPHIMIGPTGNRVEMVDPANSTYIPRVQDASVRSREKAQRLLDNVNNFCNSHTAAELEVRWRSGESNPDKPTHLFNPDPDSKGLKPANPRAALIYEGRLGGVMFTGVPLPSLGTIPRAHGHSMTKPVEMVHVYCTKNLKEAFTPNRILGVLADVISLRLRMRPAVTDLNGHQLRVVRTKIRGYVGTRFEPARVPASSAGTGPDPVLRDMRIEIRAALMVLREGQLRSTWSVMQSFR